MSDLIETFTAALPALWIADTARYLVAAALMSAIVAVFWRAGLAARKLQARRATARDIRREILTSLRSSLVFALVAHDTWFYWTHRAMHHPRLFALFHRTHHLSRTPTPWAAYAFSVPEAIVQGAFVPLFLVFLPMHEIALLLFLLIQIGRNVMGHCGVEVHPAACGPGRWLGWNTTTTHHDLHHETGRYNYGLYFRWWDRMVGTEHPDYRHKFESVVAPRAPGLTVERLEPRR